MKNKCFMVMIAATVAAFTIYNVCSSSKSVVFSDLAVSNVEALASGEGDLLGDCVSNGNGCYTVVWYPDYKEY